MSLSLCGTIGANTGPVLCDITRGNPLTIMFGSSIFTTGEQASNATLKAAMLNRIKRSAGDSEKLFPLPVIVGTATKTAAAKYGTYGYGLQTKLLRSLKAYEFDVLAGSTLERNLIAFDGQTVPCFIFDDKRNIAGKLDSGLNFIGTPVLVGVEARDYGDASNPQSTKVSISFIDAADFTENSAFFQSSFSASDLVGLKDTYIFEPSAHSTNVYKAQVKIKTAIINGDLNTYDEYGALIAALTFTAGTGTNFATPMPITTVAVDAANKALTITFDSTAYGLLAALAQIKLFPPTPAVLDAANVRGIEIAPYVFTK